jgi:predicted dehydrogenase
VHNVGVIGAGQWASNGLRVIAESARCRLHAVADLDPARLAPVAGRHPGVRTGTDPAVVVDNPDVDLVYVATPPATHAALAGRALAAGKSVLVEKPFTTDPADAAVLVALADEQRRTLMVGHTFLYSPPVLAVADLISSGALGDVFYVDAQRVNLGRYQDSGVLWDLAPHDVAILLHWLGEAPTSVSATGRSFVSAGREDVAFLTLHFPGGALAQLHLSWLSPTRLRRTTVSGARRMVVYDDTAGPEAVKVYDHGVHRSPAPESFGEAQLTYRTGDIRIPRLPAVEPLKAMWEHFVDCVETGATPRSCGRQGLVTVQVLAAAERALRTGRREPVAYPPLSVPTARMEVSA